METKQTFVGEYRHSLDAKKRLFIPAKFRELLGENFAISRINEKCLLLFSDVTPDAQGRVIIPAKLCELAELNKNAVVIGAGTHAEIWSEENWDAMENELNDEALSEAFGKLGF